MRKIFLLALLLAATTPAGALATDMTIDLASALRLAGASNLEIALASEKAAEAAARQSQARQETFLPEISLDSRFARHEGLTQGTAGEFVDVDKQSMAPGIRASLEVHFGEARYSLLAARRRHDAAGHAEDSSRRETLLRAAEQYFDLAAAASSVRVFEEGTALSEELLRQMEARVRLGVGYQVDVLRVKTELAHQRLRLLQARETLALASARLVETLALDPQVTLSPADEGSLSMDVLGETPPLGDMLDAAWRQRPEIRERMEIRSAFEAESRGARLAPFFPYMRADVFAGQFGPSYGDLDSSRDYRIFLGWRLGRGGIMDFGRRELRQSRLEASEIELEITRRRVGREVVEARAALASKKEQLVLAAEAHANAEESFRLNQGRHKLGIALPLEVIQAEEALLRSGLDNISAIAEYNKAQYRLKAAMGELYNEG